jgi:hypothetical protein
MSMIMKYRPSAAEETWRRPARVENHEVKAERRGGDVTRASLMRSGACSAGRGA